MHLKKKAVSREQLVLEACQNTVGYTFRKPELLRAALTHTSGAFTRAASNERLEFLGDSVLALVTCEQLYMRFPDYQEGDMTKVKSVVVSRKTCAAVSKSLGLGKFLFLGGGLHGVAEVPPNLLANVFESLVAAIFLDGGWDEARAFVLKHIGPEIDRVGEQAITANAKAQIQQFAQNEFGATPRYNLLDEQGPENRRCFKMAVEVCGYQYPPAWAPTKKEAELKAAQNALAEIEHAEIPYPSD